MKKLSKLVVVAVMLTTVFSGTSGYVVKGILAPCESPACREL